jgi:hypothetical protein
MNQKSSRPGEGANPAIRSQRDHPGVPEIEATNAGIRLGGQQSEKKNQEHSIIHIQDPLAT